MVFWYLLGKWEKMRRETSRLEWFHGVGKENGLFCVCCFVLDDLMKCEIYGMVDG